MIKLTWLAVGFMILLEAPLAFANLIEQFSFDGATITVDGTTQTVTTSGGASTAGSAFVFNSGSIGTFCCLVVSPTGTTGGLTLGPFVSSNSPAGGCCTFPQLDFFTSITNKSGATGTLTITIGDTGFTLPSENPTSPATLANSVLANAANTNVSNVSVGFTNFFDSTNAQSGGQSLFSGTMNLGIDEQTSLKTASVSVGTTPFSLTNIYTFTLANGDSLSGISHVNYGHDNS